MTIARHLERWAVLSRQKGRISFPAIHLAPNGVFHNLFRDCPPEADFSPFSLVNRDSIVSVALSVFAVLSGEPRLLAFILLRWCPDFPPLPCGKGDYLSWGRHSTPRQYKVQHW